MQYIIPFLTLLVFHTRAIEFALFEDNDCDTEEDPSHTCFNYDYGDCCGSISTDDTPKLFGAAAVAMGGTPITNTPVLRAGSEGRDEFGTISPCALIRGSWEMENEADGTFPCAMGDAPMTLNGYVVESIVTTKRGEHMGEPARKNVAPNGWSVVENGTFHGIQRDSEAGKVYVQEKDKMTTKERRAFIIKNSEPGKRKTARCFKA